METTLCFTSAKGPKTNAIDCQNLEPQHFDYALTHLLDPDETTNAVNCEGLTSRPLEVISGSGPWQLCGMLMLSRPDRRWTHDSTWLPPSGLDVEQPLFDAHGIRSKLRESVAAHDVPVAGVSYKPASYVPIRRHLALALDEETGYADFSAYVAYRFGYRAAVPRSYREFVAFTEPTSAFDFTLTFEDLFLKFPDEDKSETDLQQREQDHAKLASASRTLVTVNHEHVPEALQAKNEAFLYSKRQAGQGGNIVKKPLAGVFALWQEAGIAARHKTEWLSWAGGNAAREKLVRDLRPQHWRWNYAPGFVWPPLVKQSVLPGSATGHSAPARLFAIARALIARATKLWKDGPNSVSEAVKGAVLAIDALELLGGRTPTTALEALTLKHQFEVLAECQFIGVRHNIAVEPRVKEIQEEIRFIAQWFAEADRLASSLDAEVVILGKLTSIFRDQNQFDEEWECLSWQRSAMVRLSHERSKSAGLFASVSIRPVRRLTWWYLNTLIRRPENFILGILFWLGAGTFAFSLDAYLSPDGWMWSGESFGTAMDAFFAGNAPQHATTCESWISRSLTVCGLFHFGVFISYVYTLVSRR